MMPTDETEFTFDAVKDSMSEIRQKRSVDVSSFAEVVQYMPYNIRWSCTIHVSLSDERPLPQYIEID